MHDAIIKLSFRVFAWLVYHLATAKKKYYALRNHKEFSLRYELNILRHRNGLSRETIFSKAQT